MSSEQTPREITLLVRSGCHLCLAAIETLDEVTSRLDYTWQKVDIDQDAELLARHSEEVPVLLVDGRVRDFWVIDAQRLETLLTS
ncbi:glutaredoxin family protein [Paeniglutamicibacter sp. ABSL32-1]|uniref:glutaredoxin family protein n=1 Tax=Paeniglutamicibacter quisquiliarum TaxID=2849498 RepID=UPI001C2CCEB4|nr:glutaredoxin family protein [Paeniglutamicibacter quisquiliarum]MBV1780692.1 glutaredoxin family protein [Paeniglutamicibacter quisquiliarum]